MLRGVSQTELSQLSAGRLDQAVIARHESAVGPMPRAATLGAYAGALRIPMPILADQKDPGCLLQDIFRPFSPWRRLPVESRNRVVADLSLLLPQLWLELGLDRSQLFRCSLGSVVVLAGAGHRMILLLPPDLQELEPCLATLGQAGAEQVLSERCYLALLLDPESGLDHPELPRALQLAPRPQLGGLYQAPRPRTEVVIELQGERAEVRAMLERCLQGEQVLRMEVSLPQEAGLPDTIRDYLESNRLHLDPEGHLKKVPERH
jgi:hypothetical protein